MNPILLSVFPNCLLKENAIEYYMGNNLRFTIRPYSVYSKENSDYGTTGQI